VQREDMRGQNKICWQEKDLEAEDCFVAGFDVIPLYYYLLLEIGELNEHGYILLRWVRFFCLLICGLLLVVEWPFAVRFCWV
jgi:hypothetical protein